MVQTQRLQPEERRFFSLLADVIFSNPFSTERDQVEAMLEGVSQVPHSAQEHHYSAVVPVLEARLKDLAGRGIDTLASAAKADRSLLEYAFLFRSYHRFVDRLDAIIRSQSRQGDEPVPVPFAGELLAELAGKGIGEAEALRYLALFYQLRRAYYFIAQALIGESPSMKRLRHALWNNVFTSDVRAYGDYLWDRMEDFSTLLLGETGTGKGSAAAAIGRSGLIPFDPGTGRFRYSFTETFTATNLSQFPESLIESELFGHRKGSFTGAIDNHKGLFERCSAHGALFLDEIGDVSVPVQIKLLNVIQDRRFIPVGSHRPLRFAGRVIAATNRSLVDLRREGRFRDDFFYRLSSDVIEVPPLRVRLRELPSELVQLVTLLVERMTGGRGSALVDRVMNALRTNLEDDYPWPGNVRELEQAVRRILLNGSYSGETPDVHPEAGWQARLERGELTAQQVLAGYCHDLYRRFGTYEEVARRADLDRRTAKKYVEMGAAVNAG